MKFFKSNWHWLVPSIFSIIIVLFPSVSGKTDSELNAVLSSTIIAPDESLMQAGVPKYCDQIVTGWFELEDCIIYLQQSPYNCKTGDLQMEVDKPTGMIRFTSDTQQFCTQPARFYKCGTSPEQNENCKSLPHSCEAGILDATISDNAHTVTFFVHPSFFICLDEDGFWFTISSF